MAVSSTHPPSLETEIVQIKTEISKKDQGTKPITIAITIIRLPIQSNPKCATRTAALAAQPATNQLLATAAAALLDTPRIQQPSIPSTMMVSPPMPQQQSPRRHQMLLLLRCPWPRHHITGIGAWAIEHVAMVEDASVGDRSAFSSAWWAVRFGRRRRGREWLLLV